eukprot:6445835-Amphidinium_carterae.1
MHKRPAKCEEVVDAIQLEKVALGPITWNPKGLAASIDGVSMQYKFTLSSSIRSILKTGVPRASTMISQWP